MTVHDGWRPDFTDLWPTLRKESGVTEHSKGKGNGKKRTDRALAKLPRWQPVDVQLMFDQALLPGPFLLDVLPSMYSNFVHLKPEVDTNGTFISDHLGLLTLSKTQMCRGRKMADDTASQLVTGFSMYLLPLRKADV
ncbi:unnamed protein product [Symbiodinium natans]|uniref:Uncharacterized protein n=1 Tax=Symbiodinium natans TaxID=878477 RepID=A0A812U4Q5_9DINO|nr:unnamed protein product [Symbiodinium natans]